MQIFTIIYVDSIDRTTSAPIESYRTKATALLACAQLNANKFNAEYDTAFGYWGDCGDFDSPWEHNDAMQFAEEMTSGCQYVVREHELLD